MAHKPTYEELEDRIRELEQSELQLKESRNASHNSMMTYQNIFNAVNDAIFVHDFNDGKILYVNQKMLEMYGYTKEEVSQLDIESISEGIPPFSRVEADKNIQKAARGEEHIFDWKAKRKSGITFWVEVSLKIDIFDGEKRIIAVVRDIDRRKRAEEISQENEKRYRRLVENSPDIIYRISIPNGKLEYVSPAVKNITGYLPDEWLNHHNIFQEIIPQEQWDNFILEFSKALNGRVTPIHEYRIIHKNGSILWINQRTAPVRNNAGEIVAIEGIITDITDRRQAEEALKSQRDRYQWILAGTNLGAWERNIQNGEIIINDRWANIIGYCLDEISPTSFETLVKYTHPEDLERSNSALEKHLQGESDYYEFEGRMKHKDGHWVWVHDTGRVMSWQDDGKPLWMYGTHQDITNRKKTEDRLRRSEDLSNSIQRLSKIGTWEWDISNQNLFLTEEVYRIHDLEPDPEEQNAEATINNSLYCFRPEDRPVIRNAFERCIEEGVSYKLEFPFTTTKGRRIWIETSAKRVTGEDGRNRVVGYIMDISERKRNEEALNREEKRYKIIIETGVDGFWLADLHGRILEVNDSYCHMCGYTKEELLAMSIPELEGNFSSDETLLKIDEAVAAGHQRFETKHRRKDGSHFDVEVSVKQLQDENGKLVVFIRDISDAKVAEKEQERLQAQLTQAQKMESIGRLAGGVAHDINNMLSIILGQAELLLLKTDPGESKYTALQQIITAGNRSADITRQLLAFARQQTVALKVLNLNDTLRNMLKMIRRLIGENIHVSWLPGKELWPVKIDPSQIDQILVNLCVNARDAIKDVGKITIETGKVAFDEEYCRINSGFVPGDFVSLSVSDNGCGMEKDVLEKIFEPFFTTKGISRGTGLGLSTVYGIVKQNNGFINVYSEPNLGTTFKIYFSRYSEDVEQILEKTEVSINTVGNETILLVEDEPLLIEINKQMLERLGYRVLTANTAQEAIEWASDLTTRIHLLMTDVVMPGMNGRDLSRKILAIHPHLKVLFMSGYTTNVIVHHGVLDEGIHFIPKPFSIKDLSIKVREVLDGTDNR